MTTTRITATIDVAKQPKRTTRSYYIQHEIFRSPDDGYLLRALCLPDLEARGETEAEARGRLLELAEARIRESLADGGKIPWLDLGLETRLLAPTCVVEIG